MKYIEKIQEFLHDELDDYSYFKWELTSEEDTDYEYYSVEISIYEKPVKTILLKTDGKKIEIETGEDVWEETNTYNWRVKYFWMTLLSWEL